MQSPLIGGIEKREIKIVDYDPRWQEVFSEPRSRSEPRASGEWRRRSSTLGRPRFQGWRRNQLWICWSWSQILVMKDRIWRKWRRPGMFARAGAGVS